MSRPGHTYVLSLGSGGSAALIGRVHHLAGQHGVQPVAPSDRLQRWQQKGALLQHANALNCAAAKASLCKRTGLKKGGVLCRRMSSILEQLCKHTQANEHAACRKAWHVQGKIARETQTRRPAQTCCFARKPNLHSPSILHRKHANSGTR